jgi:hypothetical protein
MMTMMSHHHCFANNPSLSCIAYQLYVEINNAM